MCSQVILAIGISGIAVLPFLRAKQPAFLPTIDIFRTLVDIQQAVRRQRRLIGVAVRIRPRVFAPAAGHRKWAISVTESLMTST